MSIAQCARCGKPLERGAVRYNLTHSPNADYLRGWRQDYPIYSMHRDLVIQHPTHEWELLCPDCFSTAHLLPRGGTALISSPVQGELTTSNVAAVVGQAVVEETITCKEASSTQPNKFYEVTLYPFAEPPRAICTCPWAQNVANQDQGVTQKYCKHVTNCLKKGIT